MIRYSLQCEHSHKFDGWFRSSSDWEDQASRGLLACAICGSASVQKALMAPAVASGGEAAESAEAVLLGDREQRIRAMLRDIRSEITANAENVGSRFAEVARQMHEGEIERASVYGVASREEARSLAEDGIEFHPLPPPADEGH